MNEKTRLLIQMAQARLGPLDGPTADLLSARTIAGDLREAARLLQSAASEVMDAAKQARAATKGGKR